MQDTAKYFDAESAAWSARYDASPHFRTRLETTLGWIAAHPGPLDLLDYGCGSGVLLRALAPLGHRLTGVDVSEGMLAAARETLSGVPGDVRLEQVDAPHAEYAARTYDGVTCLGVVEYVDDAEAFLARVAGLVKPGGFLIVSYPNRASLLRKFERAVFRHARLFRALGLFGHLTGPDSYLHVQRHQFTLAGMSSRLAAHGLRLYQHKHHVAPGPLQSLALLGMTTIAEFRKA